MNTRQTTGVVNTAPIRLRTPSGTMPRAQGPSYDRLASRLEDAFDVAAEDGTGEVDGTLFRPMAAENEVLGQDSR